METETKELERRFRLDLMEKSRALYLGQLSDGRVTDVEAETLHKALVWLNALGKEKIKLYIDSGGGEARAGLSIHDGIKNSVAPVDGIVIKRADSMASVILQGCAHRVMYPHASMYLHGIRAHLNLDESICEEHPAFDLKKIEREVKRMEQKRKMRQEHMERIFLARTGLPLKKIRALCGAGTNLTAEEALSLNLIDEIR